MSSIPEASSSFLVSAACSFCCRAWHEQESRIEIQGESSREGV